jgi:ATP-dependent Clp protease protease subunit
MPPRLDLIGVIGEDAASFSDPARFLEANPGEVVVGINSPGGVASDGAAMMAAMESHGKVQVSIVGMAASAASLAAMGGAKIAMHSAALMMIHEPSAFSFGTAEEHCAGADALEKMTEVYAKAYARATGHSVQRIAAWMKEETWLTAEEAFELNFCDEIEARQNDMQMVAAFDYGRF